MLGRESRGFHLVLGRGVGGGGGSWHGEEELFSTYRPAVGAALAVKGLMGKGVTVQLFLITARCSS